MEEETLDKFMEKYEERLGLEAEDKVNYYLDYAIRDENFAEPTGLRKEDSITRWELLKKLIRHTNNKVIESNIYLKKCAEYMCSSKEDAAELLLEHLSTGKKNISLNLLDDKLMVRIDEANSNELVQKYNNIVKKTDKMYEEIVRMQIWNILEKDTENTTDIGTVYIKRDENTLNASFQNSKKNGRMPRLYIKKR